MKLISSAIMWSHSTSTSICNARSRRAGIVESGKNVTFFEQLFCFYQLVLVVWNTFGAKFKLPFISWVKQNWHFCGNGGKNCPSPIWGDFWGKRGSGKNHFSGRGFSRGLHDSPLSTRSPYHLYSFSGVRHVCHDDDGWFVYTYVRWQRYPRLQALRPVEHIFHCLSNVWFFRQAHKRPTKLDDQFLEILTCWTRWQASFFIILKGKTSKPAQMNSSFTKIFEAEKIWQK